MHDLRSMKESRAYLILAAALAPPHAAPLQICFQTSNLTDNDQAYLPVFFSCLVCRAAPCGDHRSQGA
eukprot:CAMPEP_0172624002 /NCGR_PEP_ID=MMETSP1068-20121228/133151_1 /TAXON_ID=35684 /ORGANISM="Pseudopedinella elastica, Strain CCMP716" /LENGTH=67 /DNA_ID=CAMNT_0013432783 /DNA_START=118 /DNA_END=317 /DNA_ORIENTATION=-